MSKKSIRFFNDCVVRAVWDDGLILRDGVPYIWQFDGGYVELDTNGTPTSWNYYVTDHLGSTRKVVDSNNNVKETINYYQRLKERGKHPLLVHNNIKNKMLHILVAMVRDRVKYNPDYVYRANKEIA